MANLRGALLILLTILGIGSCSSKKTPVYTNVQLRVVSATAKGDQAKVLEKYGLPDRAYAGSFGTTLLVYCGTSGRPRLIEFDEDGEAITSVYVPLEVCGSKAN